MIRNVKEKTQGRDSCATRNPKLVCGMRESSLKEIFHVAQPACIYPHQFTKIKNSDVVPSCTGGQTKPLAPYFGRDRSYEQGGRAEFLKTFKYWYMAEQELIVNSKDVRHKAFLTLHNHT